MPYQVINDFRDKENNNILYRKGDVYPEEGYEPTKERIEELLSDHPVYKQIFIEKVETEEEKTARELKEKEEKEKAEDEEKSTIRKELESLGVSVHPNTGLEKLREKLEEAKEGKENKE
ncbi:hypothetical protein [Heyndrickxia oleronia]|uniref:hypothetical protein n=1 Tax=Heyndrickxia oleronia TaxID=38875 RepID=UPI001C0F1610|nr:hypothetical protein [Heyndrickxia oleronia]MBU5214566.1 hypothetical protein [Heyndrickxia oleronia]